MSKHHDEGVSVINRVLLASLIAGVFTLTINLGSFLLPIYSAEFLSLANTQIGLLVGAPGMLAMVLMLPAAALSNYWGRKPVMIFSAMANLTAAALFLMARSFTGLLLAQMIFGIANATLWPALIPHFASLASVEHQARIQAVNTTAQGIGLMLGPLVAGVLIREIGFAGAISAWIGGAALQLGMTATVSERPGVRAGLVMRAALVDPIRKLSHMAKNPALVIAGGSQLLTGAVIGAVGGAFFILFTQSVGYAAALASVMLATREASSTASRALYAFLARRIPNTILLSLVPVIAGGALLVGFVSPRPVVLFVVVLVEGFALGITAPASNTLATEQARPEDLAEAVAAVSMMFQVGLLVFPPLTGTLVSSTSLTTGISLGTVLVVALGLPLLVYAVRTERRLRQLAN